jgi:hypothetical protein
MNEGPTLRRIAFSGETFETFDCIAKPRPLSWGISVRIDICKSDKCAGSS